MIFLLLFLFSSLSEEKELYFIEYKEKADTYLDRECFNGTPLSGELLSNSAKKVYDSTGVLVPLELVLAQAQLESCMGLKGRSPEKNPFNLGEWVSGTKIKFNTIEEGTKAYYFLLSEKYLKCSDVDGLLDNFVNCDNRRYASSIEYEKKLKKQYYFIKKWIDKYY